MPFLLTTNSVVLCAHGGKANPSAPNPRVKTMGTPTGLLPSPHLVAGCPFVTPAGAPLPCVNGTWVLGTLRVRSTSQPLQLDSGSSVSAPTGAPLTVIPVPGRVKAT